MPKYPVSADDVEAAAKRIDAIAEQIRRWKNDVANLEKLKKGRAEVVGMKGIDGAIERLAVIVDSTEGSFSREVKIAERALQRFMESRVALTRKDVKPKKKGG